MAEEETSKAAAAGDLLGLSNLKYLSEPMRLLIEKASQGVGGLYRPKQIKRIADAESYAELARARTRVKVAAIEDRAAGRVIEAEARKQVNIESVVAKALPDVANDAKPQRIDDDWLVYFFEKASLFSNDEMQALWAKILAGEANSPGVFSKRTLNALSILEHADAQRFTKLAGFVWRISNDDVPVVFDTDASIYKDQGVTFGSLTQLDAIGLISFSPSDSLGFNFSKEGKVLVSRQGKDRIFILPKDVTQLEIGHVVFTSTGRELYRICKPADIDGYERFALDYWKQKKVGIKPVKKGETST